jgi:hypothetical protein
MKPLASIVPLILLSAMLTLTLLVFGCATNLHTQKDKAVEPSNAVMTTAKASAPRSPAAVQKTISVTWQGKLNGSYEQFVIQATPQLPPKWETIWTGNTNRLRISTDQPQCFYRVGVMSEIYPN